MKVTAQQMMTIRNEEHNRSDKYNVINTLDVINTFKEKGFEVSAYQEARFRKEEKQHKVKHFVRMRYDSVNGIDREVVIMNSHDGSSSLKLNFGLFRMVCNNQLVFGDSLLPTERINHSSQDPFARITRYAEAIEGKLEEEEDIRECMMRKIILPYEMRDFAHEAMKLREDDMSTILDSNLLNIVNRREDIGSDLFVVYNRIQENLMKGNYKKFGTFTDPETGEMSEKYKSAKILTAGDRIIDINKSLHELALSYI